MHMAASCTEKSSELLLRAGACLNLLCLLHSQRLPTLHSFDIPFDTRLATGLVAYLLPFHRRMLRRLCLHTGRSVSQSAMRVAPTRTPAIRRCDVIVLRVL